MADFNEREKAFEAKYRHDQELAFKVGVRRNKLLGLWAADLMKLPKAEAEGYAKKVVEADFERPGDEDVLTRVQSDLKAKGIDMSERQIRKEMDRLMAVAKTQIMQETAGR
jgi:hypothetical protein